MSEFTLSIREFCAREAFQRWVDYKSEGKVLIVKEVRLKGPTFGIDLVIEDKTKGDV